MHFRAPSVLALVCAASLARASLAAGLSEQDYFSDLPEVLTVTRLAQPLSETPGAVTVIDRETIRRSGARELVDVLRLVPGYFVAGWNGANPNAVYHTPIDDYGTRNLVMIDGRSVYSPFFLGDTHRGMMGVLLEDIERIEVLRGANSAAYGANAMFGVINIVTRHAGDTHGAMLAVTGGEGGIDDNSARIGWGDERASFRVSAGRRQDSGYRGAYDDKRVGQLHFRGDLRPAADQDVMLLAGISEVAGGEGFPLGTRQNPIGGNPFRTIERQEFYLQGEWRRQLDAAQEIKLSAHYAQEDLHDRSGYAALPGIVLDFGGRGRRLNLELQHQIGIAPTLKAVWGAGYKREDARSQPLYATDQPIAYDERRLFGNLEWHPHAAWTINAGGFWGDDSRVGGYFAPRLMANFHMLPDHTLRIGATKSVRSPTVFERDGDVRYYLNGVLVGRTVAARGLVEPEQLYAEELGYFGNFRDWRLTLDVRAFRERMTDRIAEDSYNSTVRLAATGRRLVDYINNPGMKSQGLEYQLRWKPLADTEIWLNQTFLKQRWDDDWDDRIPPTHASTIALFQKLPFDLDLSLIYHSIGAMTWRGDSDWLPGRRRFDARLAYPFRIGSTRAEAAVAVQAANGDYVEFLPSAGFKFERRAYATLRLEF